MHLPSPFSADSAHPSFVIEGFIREDMVANLEKLPPGKPFPRGQKFLRRGAPAVVGAYVKLHLACKPVYNEEFDEDVSRCLLGGQVHTVHTPHAVVATVTVTSLPAPLELEKEEWEVELEYVPEMKHPWVLRAMRPRKAN